MRNRIQHIDLITTVAKALEEINEQVVYVGGAIVSLYITDPGAPDVRPTDDVDIILEITSVGKLEDLRLELREKGFIQSSEDDVICRFRYKGVKVDVMATKEVGWAPANPWFEPGFHDLETREVNDIKIRILSLPYYLASKLTAFRSRAKDPRTSHDLEDIVYILDNRDDITNQFKSAQEDVKIYLKKEFSEIIEDDAIREAILANLEYRTQTERFAMIEQKINEFIDGN